MFGIEEPSAAKAVRVLRLNGTAEAVPLPNHFSGRDLWMKRIKAACAALVIESFYFYFSELSRGKVPLQKLYFLRRFNSLGQNRRAEGLDKIFGGKDQPTTYFQNSNFGWGNG
jgi:hypothetical protein